MAFAFADPDNSCVTNGSFVASQIVNGLIIGIIYGFMALGLTLIFSILGVVSFAHGEFYMIGGMLVYWTSPSVWLPGISPVLAGALCACARRLRAIGAVFERHVADADVRTARSTGRSSTASWSPSGWPFTLQYFVQAIAGANPGQGPQRFFDFPRIRWPEDADPWLIKT